MEKKTTLFQCFDKNNNLINNFDSLKSASDWVAKKKYVGGSINDCIIGRQPTAYGYIWKKIKYWLMLSRPEHKKIIWHHVIILLFTGKEEGEMGRNDLGREDGTGTGTVGIQRSFLR
jgi:hypothetical protein